MKNIINIQIEDEKHFVLHCKKFNTQRNIFNEKISNIHMYLKMQVLKMLTTK